MDWFETAGNLDPKIKTGNTEECLASITKIMKALPEGPFHQVLQLDFTNPPKKVAKYFDDFIKAQSFKPAALYTETNGFDINTDLWYFSPFAYKEYGGHDDYDWLSQWDSEDFDDMTLEGMESLQEVYASDAFDDDDQDEAREHASLLVVVRFQDLIKRSVPFMRNLKVPILATGHDFDFIAEFKK